MPVYGYCVWGSTHSCHALLVDRRTCHTCKSTSHAACTQQLRVRSQVPVSGSKDQSAFPGSGSNDKSARIIFPPSALGAGIAQEYLVPKDLACRSRKPTGNRGACTCECSLSLCVNDFIVDLYHGNAHTGFVACAKKSQSNEAKVPDKKAKTF